VSAARLSGRAIAWEADGGRFAGEVGEKHIEGTFTRGDTKAPLAFARIP
jgi:hypothetical protein